jgi:8-oxo-dGTP pyrophosphatase MutT (NUDIX family)
MLRAPLGQMSFEPQKLLIGLVDFFAIFLPGALLAYLGKDWGAAVFLGYRDKFSPDGAQPLIVFLFASYLLGHLIFLLGAFLDDWIYDPLRSATRWGQIRRLASGKRLYPRWLRWLAESHLLFGGNADGAVMKIQSLKVKALEPISAAGAVNGYQWSRALLSKQHPEGFLAVQRFEADSKFFRSFVIVLVILIPVCVYHYHWKLGLICFALLVPALLRYMDQRFKGTQHAYWLVITLEGRKPQTPALSEKRDGPSHAGGVVYRPGKSIEYLQVQSSNKKEWVLPKGHIEAGEDMRETAVREVLEETGCWARVVQWIGDAELGTKEKPANTRVFLMEFLEDTRDEEPETVRNEERQPRWGELGDKEKRPTFQETTDLLVAADTLRKSEKISSH